MAFEVIGREVGHVRRRSTRPTLSNRILSTQGVGQDAASALLGLIKSQQFAMLTNGHSFRGAGRSIAILDDVASNSCWFYSDAEAGEGGVPDDDLRSLGWNLLDSEFRQLLLRHCSGDQWVRSGKRQVSTGKRKLARNRVPKCGALCNTNLKRIKVLVP